MKQQPCKKDCPDRKRGCHSTCEKYLTFRKNRLEELEFIHKEKERNSVYTYKKRF